MVKVTMEEIPIVMFFLGFASYHWEGRDGSSAIDRGDIHSCDDELIVGKSTPVYVERRAELV